MLPKRLVILFFLCLSITVKAQDILLVFYKNEIIENYKIKDSSEINQILEKIIKKYWRDGFISASADSIRNCGKMFCAYFYKGPRYYIDSISIKTSDSTILYVKKFNNKVFDLIEVEKDIKKYNKIVVNQGYPFANPRVQTIFNRNKAIVDVIIEKGIKIVCDSIYYNANKMKISERFLSNYLDFKKGRVFVSNKTKNIDRKLEKLEFISVLSPSEIEYHPGTADLFLYLKSLKKNELSGILSFSNVNSKFSLLGEVNVKFVNIFKSADYVYVNWKQLQAESQNFNLKILLPYICGLPIGISGDYRLRKIDSSNVDIFFHSGLNYFFNGLSSIGASYDFERSVVFSKSSILKSYTSNWYGVYLKIDNLDFPANPRKGIEYNFDIKTGIKESEDTIVNQFRFTQDFIFSFPLLKNMILFLKNKTSILKSPQIYENELYKFGGNNSIRGFDEQSLSANWFNLSSFEFRYLLNKYSRVYIFSDYAVYRHKSNVANYFQHPFSIGIGTSLNLKTGLLSISVAVGKLDNEKFNFQNTKVHIGFITRF